MHPKTENSCYNSRSASEQQPKERVKSLKDGLLQRLKKHDEKALEAIMDQYTNLVVKVILNISNGSLSTEDIEETTADVFVTLWNNADKVLEGKLKGYICSIARTRTLNRIAATTKKTVLNIDDYDPEDDFSIEYATEEKDIHRELREIISDIRMPDREILIRYYYYNQSVSQISNIMGINLATVKSKLKRTREKIKALLTERSYTL